MRQRTSSSFWITSIGFTALAVSLFWMQENGQFELASKSQNRNMTLGDVLKVITPSGESEVILNDPGLNQAWGLKNAAALKAWSVSTGSQKKVVAVIDTGCDIRHPDLKKNIWTNPKEKDNGRDNDGNGLVGDINGWNFVSNNHDLTDNHGHGTHIAGIIGAEAGNKIGIAGVAPNVSIMCLKYFDPKVAKTDNLKNTIAAIRYAVKMKVDVINYSGGGTEYSPEERAAIEEAEKAGILFVAAAGNERSNSDKFKYYPADYGLSNIISVTAIDQKTQVLASSNYGVETVDLAAPGHDIISTFPDNSYGKLTGTSQATAFVTGAAVLVMAAKPNFTYADVKKHILSTGDAVESLAMKTRTSRQLNLYKALTVLDADVTPSGMVASRAPSTVFSVDPSVLLDPTSRLNLFGTSLIESVKPAVEMRLSSEN